MRKPRPDLGFTQEAVDSLLIVAQAFRQDLEHFKTLRQDVAYLKRYTRRLRLTYLDNFVSAIQG